MCKSSYLIKAPFVLSAISLACVAYANEPVVHLGQITTTATKNATPIKNTIAQTTIITADELKHYQGQSVLDVLKSIGTISHYTNGGRGKTSNFYLRGYDGKQILVLIDGIRYSSMTTGAPNLGVLPADQIDRIEIVHGASGASVYGADAMGGVIQIFSKKGDLDHKNLAITAGVGSHQQRYYGINVHLNTNNAYANIAASKDKSQGFNATTTNNTWAYHADKDGFDSKNISANVGYDFGAIQGFGAVKVGGQVLLSDTVSQFDNGTIADVYGKHKAGATSAFVDWRYAPNAWVVAKIGQSQDNYTAFDGADVTGRLADIFNTKQTQTNLTVNHALATGKLIGGLEQLNQSVDSTNNYTTKNRTIQSGFVGYQVNQDKLDGTAFIRHTKNSQFGNKTTYHAGLSYRLLPNVRVGTSLATGFRVPTLNELYDSSFGINNPNLRPESTQNSEAFVEFDNPNHRTRLSAYRNTIKDMIAWQAKPTATNTWAGQYANINQASIQGVSLSSDWYLGNYQAGLSYDYQNAKDSTPKSPTYNNQLAIRPTHKGVAYLGYHYDNINLRAEYQHTGHYYSNVNNLPSQKVNGYGLVNISGTYQINDLLSINTRINNLFNKQYITLPNYAEDGTNFYTAVTIKY